MSLLISGVSGAASGFVDLLPGEGWKWEAGIAVLGSLAEDLTSEKGEPNYWAAIGAGVGAGLWHKYGKAKFKGRFGDGNFSQASGKIISKAIKEVFGAEVDLAAEEMKEFLRGFIRAIENADEAADYWEKQFDDWFWGDDKDPIF